MLLSIILKWLSKIFLFTGRVARKNNFDRKLTHEEEQELLAAVSTGNKDAEEKLVRHNLRLVAHIASKYNGPKHEQDDLISVGSIGLIKAVRSFNPERANNFSTYASRCIENEILMLFRSEKKFLADTSLDNPIGVDKDGNEISLADILIAEGPTLEQSAEISTEYKKVEQIVRTKLDPREREIISERYGMFGKLPKTQKELAKQMGISRSYISRIEKHALDTIADLFKTADHTY